MSGSLAKGVYKQLRAHDKQLDRHLAKARERGQAAADAAAALQVCALTRRECALRRACALTRGCGSEPTRMKALQSSAARPW
jgi:hypothetical protein